MVRLTGTGRRSLLVAAVAALLLACAAQVGAAAGLLPDEPLSDGTATWHDLAMAPNGYAAVAWGETLAGGQFAVGIATRPPGGAWSRPLLLGTSGVDKFLVSVAVDAAGDVAVAWEEIVPPNVHAFVASRAAGGAFTAPEQLTDATSVSGPVVGIDAGGRVTLLYGPYPAVVERDFSAGGSALAAAPQTLSSGSPSPCFPGLLAVAPTGDAVAGWQCGGAVFALRRAGTWSISPPIADDANACPSVSTTNSLSGVAIDSLGRPAGLVTRREVETRDSTILPGQCSPVRETDTVRLVLPIAGFMTPLVGAVATATNDGSRSPIASSQLGISSSGIVTTQVVDDGSGAYRLRVRDFAADGTTQGSDQTVDPTATIATAQLAVGIDGSGLLMWTRASGFGTPLPIAVAFRAPGGSFGAPLEVTADGSRNALLAVVLDDGGEGAIGFVDDSGTRSLHVRGFDAAPPLLGGVSIPSSAVLGTPAAFSAAPFDVWGPVTTSWSFGDGATAIGTAVTHAYASAGTFTASVTTTDAVGNAVTRSGAVQVSGVGVGGPAIRGLSLTHRRFRVGRSRTAVSARRRRAPVGTTFRFTLDRAASVKIAFARKAKGLRSGRRCVKPSRRLHRAGARRCTRLVAIRPPLTRAGRAGANSVPFSGRIGRRALAPGRYVATLTATAAGSAGQPARLRFTVVR